MDTAPLMPVASGEPTFRKRFQHIAIPYSAQLVLDAEGTIQHMTLPARRLLEYAPTQHVEPCFFSHIHGRNLYQIMRDVADMVCYGKERASWLFRMHTGTGRWRWYRASAKSRLEGDAPAILISLDSLRA